ncbi:MAG: hypothetical protein QT09_C0003G0042 [archaeon GW2011_AR18]|nr:MAG: hypothetical protein QT09_C0003G0042 [archaeon GW2011_AR18]
MDKKAKLSIGEWIMIIATVIVTILIAIGIFSR